MSLIISVDRTLTLLWPNQSTPNLYTAWVLNHKLILFSIFSKVVSHQSSWWVSRQSDVPLIVMYICWGRQVLVVTWSASDILALSSVWRPPVPWWPGLLWSRYQSALVRPVAGTWYNCTRTSGHSVVLVIMGTRCLCLVIVLVLGLLEASDPGPQHQWSSLGFMSSQASKRSAEDSNVRRRNSVNIYFVFIDVIIVDRRLLGMTWISRLLIRNTT